MIAVHLDNLLFLLLVAVAVLFQFLAKTAGKAGKGQPGRTSTPVPRTPQPIPRAATESNEERIRKFLEALGQPPTSKPPPPVAPRTDIPPHPLAPVRPPNARLPSPWRPSREGRPEVIPKEGTPPPIVTRTQEITQRKKTGAPAFEVQEAPLPVRLPPTRPGADADAGGMRTIGKTEHPRTSMATLLGSTTGLRDAILLREILGPPRALRMQLDFSDGIS